MGADIGARGYAELTLDYSIALHSKGILRVGRATAERLRDVMANAPSYVAGVYRDAHIGQ